MDTHFKVYDENWDILIILDACRFDYFESNFNKFFSGTLLKKYSSGADTIEWRNNNFKEQHKDTVYVSSNPYISNQCVNNFTGSDIFHKVYDVWNTCWNQNHGTVTPDAVSNTALEAIKTHHDKKIIIHYLQPHAPYLSISDTHGFSSPSCDNPFRRIETQKKHSMRQHAFNILAKYLRKLYFINNHLDWYAAQILCLPPQTPMDFVRRKYGVKALRDVYQKNLDSVLFEVAYMASQIPSNKKIVISADHGELLGENGRFAHPYGSNNPILRNIPWFELKKVNPSDFSKRVSTNPACNENVSIEKKLKDLGYF